MTSNHAAAPWQYTHDSNSGDGGIRNKAGYICFMAGVTRYQGQHERFVKELAERRANAWLIQAAPELLASLKKMLEIFDSGVEPFKYLTREQGDAVHFARLVAKNAEGK